MRGRAAEGAGGRWGARGRRPAGARTLADAQAGVACGRRTLGRRAGRARGARGASAAGRSRSAQGRAGWALGARPGGPGWPSAVHSACFWPGSTRYFPESKFLDIVREPGS